jgi:hypothetical protein
MTKFLDMQYTKFPLRQTSSSLGPTISLSKILQTPVLCLYFNVCSSKINQHSRAPIQEMSPIRWHTISIAVTLTETTLVPETKRSFFITKSILKFAYERVYSHYTTVVQNGENTSYFNSEDWGLITLLSVDATVRSPGTSTQGSLAWARTQPLCHIPAMLFFYLRPHSHFTHKKSQSRQEELCSYNKIYRQQSILQNFIN